MSLESLAAVLGKSLASVQRYCLPPNEANFVHPPPAIGPALKAWSGGHVHLGNCTELWTPEIDAEWLAAGLYEPAPATPSHVRAAEDCQ
jgi:hypothetical protein